MWNNDIYLEDINSILNVASINFEKLNNKKVLITGGTGLIGSLIINTLLKANEMSKLKCEIIALVRSVDKAKKMFEEQLKLNLNLTFIEGDIKDKIEYADDIDYIIHAASCTSSKKFIEEPLDIIDTTLLGVKNIMELAKDKKVNKVIFLSTMEVYGTPSDDEKINEDHSTNLLTNEVRNCYPISKRMAENICFSYSKYYDINVDVLRLTQTFGPGVQYDDGRVFASFARSVIEHKDIVLHTKGETKRCYLYIADAVSAILTVLTNDKSNEIYNVANEETYCSIYDMANLVAKECANDEIKVVIELEDINKYGYAKTLHMNLDTNKIQSLGWKPTKNLVEMFNNLIKTMK